VDEVDVVHIVEGVVDLQVQAVLDQVSEKVVLELQLQEIYKGKGHIQLSISNHIFAEIYSFLKSSKKLWSQTTRDL